MTFRILVLITTTLALGRPCEAQRATPADTVRIAEFNRSLETATRQMDNAASLALWDDDGVSLAPGSKALVGKPAIAEFLAGVTKQIAGATMRHFEMSCFDMSVAPPVAAEWCVEHQVILLADKTTFDGWGKMALVLRRGADGKWRLKQETWLPGLPSDSVLLRTARR